MYNNNETFAIDNLFTDGYKEGQALNSLSNRASLNRSDDTQPEIERGGFAANIEGTNGAVFATLHRFNYEPEDLPLLYLVPLVRTAWAEGMVTRRERRFVLEAAHLQGIAPGSRAYERLSGWLDFEPTQAFYKNSFTLLCAVLHSLPSDERELNRVTEEEVRALILQGAEAGVFAHSEREIVESVFRLDDRSVNELMMRRREVVWLDADASGEEIRRTVTENSYSRFPVCEGSLDNVIGIAKAKHLLERCLNNESLDLRAVMTAPLFVPETQTALQVLELFKNAHTHIALVIDEHGGVEGLVTINDVLEAIVGEMQMGGAESLAVMREDGSYLLDGALPIEEFAKIFTINSSLETERGDYHTLAGFVLARCDNIPKTADVFEWRNLRFEIVDMDGRRVDKVLVSHLEVATASNGV